jgi:hypothetical protein
LWTAKFSSFAPAFNFSRSQIGRAPLPAHVWPNFENFVGCDVLSQLQRTGECEPLSAGRQVSYEIVIDRIVTGNWSDLQVRN